MLGTVVPPVVLSAGLMTAEEARRRAAEVDALGAELRARAVHLAALRDTERYWRGPAARAFADRLARLCDEAGTVEAWLGELATALRRYAAELDGVAEGARRVLVAGP